MGVHGRRVVVVGIVMVLMLGRTAGASFVKSDADGETIPQGNPQKAGIVESKADLEELVRQTQRGMEGRNAARQPSGQGGEWEMRGGSSSKGGGSPAPAGTQVYRIRDAASKGMESGGHVFIPNSAAVRDTSGSPSFSIPVDSELVTTVYSRGELVGWFVRPSDEKK